MNREMDKHRQTKKDIKQFGGSENGCKMSGERRRNKRSLNPSSGTMGTKQKSGKKRERESQGKHRHRKKEKTANRKSS